MRYSRRRAFSTTLVLLGIVPGAHSWTTTAQAYYGATIAGIYNETLGRDLGTPLQVQRMQSLGYLWSMPCTADTFVCLNRDPNRGLGNSITWALDPRLCDDLLPLFEDDFWAMSLVTCDMIRASMHRAFEAWAMNSRFIKFTEVTSQCKAIDQLNADCPLAEIWITAMTRDAMRASDELATWRTTAPADFPADFVSTNGDFRLRQYGPHMVARPVVETQRGVLSIRTKPLPDTMDFCWYMDSQFCERWHSFKRAGPRTDAAVMHAIGVTFIFFVWGITVATMLAIMAFKIKWAIREHILVNKDGSVQLFPGVSPFQLRLEGALIMFAETPMLSSTLRFFLLMVPWTFHQGIFIMCWQCYDFEAALIQEIGSLLGLGHPDGLPRETLSGFPRAGQNAFHAGFAAGVPLTSLNCNTSSVWKDVHEGVPRGQFAGTPSYYQPGIRESVMETLTQHNPRTCLAEDDLEALNVLYPDCLGGPTEPVCAMTPYNMGGIRVLLFVVVPFFLSLIFALLLYLISNWKVTQLALRRNLSYEAFVRPQGRVPAPFDIWWPQGPWASVLPRVLPSAPRRTEHAEVEETKMPRAEALAIEDKQSYIAQAPAPGDAPAAPLALADARSPAAPLAQAPAAAPAAAPAPAPAPAPARAPAPADAPAAAPGSESPPVE